MVGLDGLEPSTSRLSGVRSNHLSYKPDSIKALIGTNKIYTERETETATNRFCHI